MIDHNNILTTEDTENRVAGIMKNKQQNYERDWLTHDIIGSAMDVHSELGPGLLEHIYENALCVELAKRKIRYTRQKQFSAKYKGEHVGDLYVDLLVEEKVIVELKSVKTLAPIHEAQLIAYLKLAKIGTGLLINFNVVALKSGVRRISV